MTIRVLVVDDQALVRAGFSMIVNAEPDLEVVGEAADGLAAVEAAERLAPDVVLMDVRMPHLDGIEATRQLVGGRNDVAGAPASPLLSASEPGSPFQPHPPLKVVMMTTFDLDEYVYSALRAGASGFLLKDVPPEQLVAGIRAVAAGDALLAPTVTRRLIEEFLVRPPGGPVAAPKALERLTEREREVLALMAQGMSNAEIAQAFVVSETTVKTHVARVLTKLGLRDRVQAVVYAYETGVVRPGEHPDGGYTASSA